MMLIPIMWFPEREVAFYQLYVYTVTMSIPIVWDQR